MKTLFQLFGLLASLLILMQGVLAIENPHLQFAGSHASHQSGGSGSGHGTGSGNVGMSFGASGSGGAGGSGSNHAGHGVGSGHK